MEKNYAGREAVHSITKIKLSAEITFSKSKCLNVILFNNELDAERYTQLYLFSYFLFFSFNLNQVLHRTEATEMCRCHVSTSIIKKALEQRTRHFRFFFKLEIHIVIISITNYYYYYSRSLNEYFKGNSRNT